MIIMRIRLRYRNLHFLIILSGGLLFCLAVLVLLSLSTPISEEEAKARVRLILSKKITQQYMHILKDKQLSQYDFDIGKQLEEELNRIKNLEFLSIEIRRLIPDILLRPEMPTHIVKVILRDKDKKYPPRYFWIDWFYFDRETSKYVWWFSI